MGTALVGVLGGYGAVGAHAARRLLAEDGLQLRIGGRDATAAGRLAAALGGRAEPAAVDATQPDSLKSFCDGCDVVLACAGPAYLLSAGSRRAAAEAGASFIDVMDGSGPHPPPAGERTAVVSAGMSPGLSGLLPRLLMALGPVDAARFCGYYVGLGTLTGVSAADYLLSLERGYGTPGACWRDGRVVPGALDPVPDAVIDGAARPLTAYPYLTEELLRQAHALGLAEARWYNAFDGYRLREALSRHRHPKAGDLRAAAEAIARASALDAAGRTPYHVLWAVLEGVAQAGVTVRRSVMIKGIDGSALTGEVAALAVREVLRGTVPRGAHQACDVLAPDLVVAALRRLPDVTVAVREDAARPVDSSPLDEGLL